MLFRRFYDTQLAQASYLVGCAATGEAIVVDANRDTDQYVQAAADEGMRITHVTETHIHADFVSGSRELAAQTGAQLLLSGEGGDDWQYAFAPTDGATLLHDGDAFMVGNVRFDVLHTPGHTPEHLTFLVTDTVATDGPMGALTGDFLFVGDVGRPDLLERAAGISGTMDAAAHTLYHSLQRLATLPDHLQIWPGHGAGSACGKALGAVPQSTLGYERLVNWGLRTTEEDEFVRMVLAGQPEPPRYFAVMKRVNRDGPALLGGMRRPHRLDAERLAGALASGATVVDVRPAADHAAAHVAGTLNIPLARSFTTWMGSLVPYDRELYLIVGEGDVAAIDDAVRDLAMIGLDRVAGWFGSEVVTTRDEAATPPQWSVAELARRMAQGDVAVVDVRGRAEWEAGHLPGVANIPLGELSERLDELPRHQPLVMQCQTGARAAMAASVLRAHGFDDVVALVGGFADWQRAGLPTEIEEAAPAGEAQAGVAVRA
jgi:hydroxyacylglutathione hydrolase